ncbi:aldo/keto reductase [Pelagicoccus sp. SDUM812003]|uniref:aldo/keto reductase n=1 Tax=Pelagicoccus sp. SDUM812003 TaxID=3041267 RepID=UPI0028102EAD|nr:aldo/keto reductase [Pelagicoccus sp. SDUM812003]MDQ8201960.1 aldo/keto reductase [Pelagicoccus sp. SDUM812003]
MNESKRNFPPLSKFVYGTTRLGHADVAMGDRMRIARAAIDSGVWFHTSRQYDDALETLGKAFYEDRSKAPPLIVKLGNNSIDEIRNTIKENIEPLGVDHIDVGQLCLGGDFAKSFATGGKAQDELRRLKEDGLVRSFFYEVFPWTSEAPYEALASGHGHELIDAFIFYLNPLQRFADNRLWDLIRERNFPVVGMRAVCGAPVHKLRDVPGAAWTPYLQERAVEVAPIFEASGIESWVEFCMRFSFSFPNVKATVGSCSRVENLEEYLRIGKQDTIEPLPSEIVESIEALQRRWSDEVDVKAEPWTM